MKKGEVIKVKIDGHNIKGKAFANVENERVYVNINAAKDQIVEGIVTRTRKRKIELKHCKIVDYANRKNAMYKEPDRQLAGANYQYYTYDEQLKIKENMIKEMLDSQIKYEYIYEEAVRSVESIGYRNKMEFSFGNEYKGGPTILGLHKQNSFHDIVDVSDCNLMDANFNRIYKEVAMLVKKYDLKFYHRIEHIGYLRNLILRKTKSEILVNLVTTDDIDSNLENSFLNELKDLLLGLELKEGYKVAGILHTLNNRLSDSVFSEKETILYGKRDIEEELFGLKFMISPYSFFQTNTKTVEKLYQKVKDYLKLLNTKDKLAFDLFSGTGTIGQIISSEVSKVYGIEIVEEAVKKANESSILNGIENCKFIAGDVFEKLDELEKADILILDPPRMGVTTKTIEKLVKYNTDNIIYVSCNPKTLLEDLKDFEIYGYKLVRAVIVDMFPYTNHVECIALIQRVK